MTNLQKFLLENLGKCEFKFNDYGKSAVLEVNNLLMFWTNFAGEKNRFGNDARNFNVVISEELKNAIESTGKVVKIHQMGTGVNEETGEEEPIVYSLNVKVKMDGPYPPNVRLFTDYRGNKSFKDLTEETIACLDHAHIISADCIIKFSESKAKENHYVCYLQKLYVIQEKRVEFDGKYDDWLEPDVAEPLQESNEEENK